MTDERRARILEVADALEAQGLEASNALVYSIAMGHRPHISEVMKARRAQRAAASGGVLVAEAEDDDVEAEPEATEAATLAEDLRQLETSYSAWHLALERLWEMEQDGPLSEAHFGRKTWLEYQLTANLQTQERLRPQLQAARTTEAVVAAQQHHDAAIPQVQHLVEQAVDALLTASQAWAALATVFDDQQAALTGFRNRQGDQAFPWLGGGAVDVHNLFGALYPGDPRALDAFRLLQTTLTVGQVRGALAGCARLQKFPVRAISTYLATITPPAMRVSPDHAGSFFYGATTAKNRQNAWGVVTNLYLPHV